MNKDIYLLIPDGTGIRNFIYTDFIERSIIDSFNITIWANEDIISLSKDINVTKLSLPLHKTTSPLIEVKRKSWQTALLKYQAQKFNDEVYNSYIFPPRLKSFAGILKYLVEQFIVLQKKDKYSKLIKLKCSYLNNVKSLEYFKCCLKQLQEKKPDLVFCTHQRGTSALAPLVAARELGIPTACFIYSWDNLPKATLFVDVDYYFVWSNSMKEEMLKYYPDIQDERIFVCGTPQFIPYFEARNKLTRADFAAIYKLPINSKWICFSGDDSTTSPYDPLYLSDFAESIEKWNETEKEALHIVFRKCPTESSRRYRNVLERFPYLITEVAPAWEAINPTASWQKKVPMKEDNALLVNTVLHCEAVVNIGSTMAHDFSILDKPCLYINYNIDKSAKWDIKEVYNFIHFRSMEGLNPVVWVNRKDDWAKCLKNVLSNSKDVVKDCQKWHQKIALFPLDKANERIVESLNKVLEKSECISVL